MNLSGVAVTERADFQIEQHVAAQAAVVENEIDAVVLVADGDAKLPRLETEAGAEFEKETLHVIEERGFEIVLRVGGPVGEAGEFEDVGIADEIFDGRGRFGGLFPRAGDDGAFVFGEAGALVELRTDLPLELANGPGAEEAFVFVECALPRIVEAEDIDQVRPGKLENLLGLERRRKIRDRFPHQ